MAWKNPDSDDSRWIYLPSLDLVKPISANDKESSFVGSDFAYEDVSGRHWNEDTHTLVGEETYQDWETWKIESVPKEDDYFEKKISPGSTRSRCWWSARSTTIVVASN